MNIRQQYRAIRAMRRQAVQVQADIASIDHLQTPYGDQYLQQAAEFIRQADMRLKLAQDGLRTHEEEEGRTTGTEISRARTA